MEASTGQGPMAWLSVKHAAQRLGLSPKSVYDLVAAQVIPARRLGLKRGKIVLDVADVEAYWDASKGSVKPAATGAASRHLRLPTRFLRKYTLRKLTSDLGDRAIEA